MNSFGASYNLLGRLLKKAEVGEAMYGVILWSDMSKKCAVIWCEDHRSLAYFSRSSDTCKSLTLLAPGDLVQFDVREEGDMRIALNPSLVAPGHYEGLTDDLIRATTPRDTLHKTTPCPSHASGAPSQVVPFPDVAAQCTCANAGSTARDLKAG